MQHPAPAPSPPRRDPWRDRLLRRALALLACGAAACAAHAQSGRLSVQVNDDRLTLAVAKAPQIYLYGPIDADAPHRIAMLMESSKIPDGSDIYLNSTGGDPRAGMALGRLFRLRSLSTHLGTPRRGADSRASKEAVCTGACAYAYLGGYYRWAPTGRDRFGLPADHASPEVAAYLKSMDVDPGKLSAAASGTREAMLWLDADQMTAAGLANNGRQFLVATSKSAGGMPYLELAQANRSGDQRITMQCRPGSIALTASLTVGATRARQILREGMRSYFEVNGAETLSQSMDGAGVVDQSVVIQRDYPAAQLGNLIVAQSLGAWIRGKNFALRYGFTFPLDGVRTPLKDFYLKCWQHAPWQVNRNAR